MHVDALLYSISRCVVKESQVQNYKLDAKCEAKAKETLCECKPRPCTSTVGRATNYRSLLETETCCN